VDVIFRLWHWLQPSDVRALFVLACALPVCLVAYATGASGVARLLWVGALIAITAPFGDFQTHSHWAKVNWIPFAPRSVKMSDVLANVLIYVPFGWFGRPTRLGRRVAEAALLALLLSAALEFTQVFSHNRFPSMTDVTCNVIGAFVGAAAATAGADRVRRS